MLHYQKFDLFQMKNMNKSILFLFGIAFLLYACSETTSEVTIEPEMPVNPFDGIDYSTGMEEMMLPDSHTFLGLHTYIFSSSCNQPGCHDGTFEPNFRTVQSAYNSLVLHPINKNYEFAVDGREPLPCRVTPGQPNASMMWHRLTMHNPPNFELMPSSGEVLSDKKLDLIEEWILNGARDIYGNEPMPTSQQPFSFGIIAYLNNFRIDTIRPGSPFNTFQTLDNQEIELWFGYLDYDLNGNFQFGNTLTYNKLKLSKNLYDFSDAIELDLEIVPTPLLINSIFSQPDQNEFPYYQRVIFNPNDLGFSAGDLVFMRSYIKDADHDEVTENPQTDTQVALQLYFSFMIN
ncbi:MAG: hypothetical protein ACI9XO_000637 [Paraglaciecola sp.]